MASETPATSGDHQQQIDGLAALDSTYALAELLEAQLSVSRAEKPNNDLVEVIMSLVQLVQKIADTFQQLSELLDERATAIKELTQNYSTYPQLILTTYDEINASLSIHEYIDRDGSANARSLEKLASVVRMEMDQGNIPQAEVYRVVSLLDAVQENLAAYRESVETVRRAVLDLSHTVLELRRKLARRREQSTIQLDLGQPWFDQWCRFLVEDLFSWIHPFV